MKWPRQSIGLYAGAIALIALAMLPLPGAGAPLGKERLAELVLPPYSLGEPVNDKGVWGLVNSGGTPAGYVFETEPLAPLPGFSGAPINVLVMIDLEGRFLDLRLIHHNEPIFVSGLGEAPFHRFFEQYRGHSINSTLVVGVPYGHADTASSLVYLDGVTKATASVRIAHESVLAATLAVVREKMQGVISGPPSAPNPNHDEALNWQDLVDQGLARHRRVSNAEVQKAFAGTLWEGDDPEALEDPEGAYLDLWIVDLGPPSIARAVLSDDSLAELAAFRAVSPNDEPLLLLDAGRHGLVSPDFVRNTSPDWLSATQDGLPVTLRDADLLVNLKEDLPDGTAMILRSDRRLGFDPTREWTLNVLAVRKHGSFQPQVGTATLSARHKTAARFYLGPGSAEVTDPWRQALRNRAGDLTLLSVFLSGLLGLLALGMNRLAALHSFTPARLAILAAVTGFVGWWGQGQLSIVTLLAVLRAAVDGGSLAFLLFDPFSLLVWAAAILGLFLWGRGLFCGWLCPFGALQEFAHHIGLRLGLRQIEPPARWDRRLKAVKYGLLAGLVAVVFATPDKIEIFAEVEPFKTAITVAFRREWIYVLYAASWLALGLFLFKGFCRYICPLGAAMALAGLLRRRDWIARRAECGAPCQLCRVRCKYGAIAPSGRVDYSECFQCLDCIRIHDDPALCVPQVLAERRRSAA
ncbi:4Fe-4S binding protein [Pelagibius marinus]|uniref:4Fe-4S binding protein n=1 Tax=Pelagibius marinus TaxID=2762760 RepID=UPI001D05752F|nr:4Fe-4S binding protein [Pelagibius marinus]